MVYEMSRAAIMNMWIAAAACLLLPVILLVWWIRKNRAGVKPFFIGAAVFVVFVFVLEALCHQVFLVRESGLSRFMNANIWAYVLYAALAAGIFEETGRFIAFKLLLKKENSKAASVTYGIGHGGVEAMLLVGVSMLSTIFLISAIDKMGGIDSYVALVPAESQDMMRANLAAIYTTPPYMYLISVVERAAVVCFHIALSVFVFMAAKRPGKLYFYPVAILLHAFLDVFVVLYQKGVITGIFILEIIIIVITAAAAYFAYRLYQSDAGEVNA